MVAAGRSSAYVASPTRIGPRWRLFPERDFYCVTAGSQRAMIFSDEDFTHKTIVMYEATALREVAEARDGDMTAMIVRTLLSEGRIIYDITERADDGRMGTRRIIKDGPTNLIVTTTADNLHHENETRLLKRSSMSPASRPARSCGKSHPGATSWCRADPPDVSGWHALFHRDQAPRRAPGLHPVRRLPQRHRRQRPSSGCAVTSACCSA